MIRRVTLLYATYWVLLCVLVLAFIRKSGNGPYWFIGALIIIVTFLLFRRKPIYALCTLPGTLMLGIIARIRFGDASLQLGDVHLFAITVMFLSAGTPDRPIFVGKKGLMPLVVVLITLSWLFSVDLAASTVTVFGLLELFLIYLLTLNLVKGEEDGAALLRAWLATITLCSALVILSYLRAEPLILDPDEMSGMVSGFGELKSTSTAFLRASFFITSFNYPLVCTLVLLVINLLFGRNSFAGWLSLFAALLVNIGATVLLGNKSVMAAAAIACAVAVAYLARYKRVWPALAGAVFGLIVITNLASLFVGQFIEPRQLMLFLERINSNDSLVERLKTWKSVVATVAASPHALLIGLGPDASTRGRSDIFAPILGAEHGVDSAYLFILLNYGLILLVLYLRYFLRSFGSLISRITGDHRIIVVSIMGCMLAWLVIGIGQQFGVAKTIALGVQLAAIVELLKTKRYAPESGR